MNEGNNGHLFFEPSFQNAYKATCQAFDGCCDMDHNLKNSQKALAMLDDVDVIGLKEYFDDSVVLLVCSLSLRSVPTTCLVAVALNVCRR